MIESSFLPEDPPPRKEEDCQRLATLIERYCTGDGPNATPIPGLSLYRASSTSTPVCAIYRSVLAVAAQGRKRLSLADENFEYDSRHYLITSVDLPVIGQITEASPEHPYLCAVIDLDPRRIAELAGQLPPGPDLALRAALGLGVSPLTGPVMDATLRLVSLLDTPEDIPVLAPLYLQELLYRLLTGALGGRLRTLAAADSQSHRMARAIEWIKGNYDQPLSIDALAGAANMSKSTLHHHFKALTAMSPLQYQKQLRLQEARKILLTEGIDAASAALRVGYESPSQFSREYRRQFGAPPVRDVARLR
ncbi:AraC family transcriptional regulator [Zoogloea sp.]|uniref:AraC family transcriptional regulator n=1 Tax=Zoogloea sp. TaxID=49181 RepID=UPI002621E21E|nr:AraC family transcriptional regulator [Zoogloea sp.]MDD3355016.1 AraC family transcriptional regulator [Zoogloea sp.]